MNLNVNSFIAKVNEQINSSPSQTSQATEQQKKERQARIAAKQAEMEKQDNNN
jgi:hypothetical protein